MVAYLEKNCLTLVLNGHTHSYRKSVVKMLDLFRLSIPISVASMFPSLDFSFVCLLGGVVKFNLMPT